MIQQFYDGANVISPMSLAQANAAHTEQVERHLALLRALIHRFDGLKRKLEAEESGAPAVSVVFAFSG